MTRLRDRPPSGLPGGTENVAYIVAEADLLAGFTDADDTALSIANLTASNGAVADNGNGNGIYTITLTTGFTGTVTLTYDVTDGHGGVLHHQTQSYTIYPRRPRQACQPRSWPMV